MRLALRPGVEDYGHAPSDREDDTIPKYRKKPVEIEAFQYDGGMILSDGQPYAPQWALDALKDGTMYYKDAGELFIKTLEGEHHVSVNDFIIRGVRGELYPCKPDIFMMTYDLVHE